MKMSEQDEWNEKDATWELLGKAAPRKAHGRFADDTLRAVKHLPEAAPWWPKILTFSPWIALTACGSLAVFLFMNPADEAKNSSPSVVKVTDDTYQWGEIEAVAEEEMLAAAADHLDRFSDQELAALVGF
jgi:hypothetical protein